MNKERGVQTGRDKKPDLAAADFRPEKPTREYKSSTERKVIELLEWKHPVPPARWVRIGSEGKKVLRQIAMDKKNPLRPKAITALVISKDRDHVKTLQDVLNNAQEDDLIRSVAAISLGLSDAAEAGSALSAFISDKDEFVRAKVVEALGKVGRHECLKQLSRATKDKSPLVRSNAESAIRLMKFRLGKRVRQRRAADVAEK